MKNNLQKAAMHALWFTSKLSARIALSQALASGNPGQIRDSSVKALRSVSNTKARKRLEEALYNRKG